MDFTPTDEQAAVRDLAARIFEDLSTHERLAAAGTGTDAELWKALCGAGLLAAVEEVGLLGLVLALEEQGRTTAQVPFAAACVYGVLALSAHGTAEQRERLLPGVRDGTTVVTGAFPAPAAGGRVLATGEGELTGVVPLVPWLRDATHVLVPDARRNLWLVRVADAAAEPVETTAPWSAGRLTLDSTPAERVGAAAGAGSESGVGDESVVRPESGAGPGAGAYEDVLATARTAFAGLQAGVCAGSLARAVLHTTTREQFGRPLSTNQGVLLRAADAYMDTEAIRVTSYEAAWRRDEGLRYGTHSLTAAWWASEAGTRVVHAGQHLHGGLGADIEHPVHRHFLWGRQLDAYLGCGAELLAELGELIVAEKLSAERVAEREQGRATEAEAGAAASANTGAYAGTEGVVGA